MNPNIRLASRTAVDIESHPSQGNGKAYPQSFRDMVMGMVDQQPHQLRSAEVRQLQRSKLFPCDRTIHNWRQRRIELNHYRPFHRTGNHRAAREIKGRNLIELALFRSVRPKSQIIEVKAFLFNRDPIGNLPFSNSQIHRAETSLDLTRKAASTTAMKAYLPHNLQLCHNYFHCNYSLGIADQDTDDMIDLDEMGLFLESSNRNHGKTVRGTRCDQAGVYNRGEKIEYSCWNQWRQERPDAMDRDLDRRRNNFGKILSFHHQDLWWSTAKVSWAGILFYNG